MMEFEMIFLLWTLFVFFAGVLLGLQNKNGDG